MYVLLLIAILAYPVSTLACDSFQIPQKVAEVLAKEVNPEITIQVQQPNGYISALFYNRVYLEGWFWEKDGHFYVCDITFAIKVDTEGRLLFIWHKNQKES